MKRFAIVGLVLTLVLAEAGQALACKHGRGRRAHRHESCSTAVSVHYESAGCNSPASVTPPPPRALGEVTFDQSTAPRDGEIILIFRDGRFIESVYRSPR